MIEQTNEQILQLYFYRLAWELIAAKVTKSYSRRNSEELWNVCNLVLRFYVDGVDFYSENLVSL